MFAKKIIGLVPTIKLEMLNTENAEVIYNNYKQQLSESGKELDDDTCMVVLSGVYCYLDPVKGPMMAFSSHLEGLLNEIEIKAIALHELGHIVNNDLIVDNSEGGIIINIEKELRADAYAVANGVDPKDLFSAVIKISKLAALQLYKIKKGEEAPVCVERIVEENIKKAFYDSSIDPIAYARRIALIGD